MGLRGTDAPDSDNVGIAMTATSLLWFSYLLALTELTNEAIHKPG